MKKMLGVLFSVAMVCMFALPSNGATVFSDDFESGNLDNWIIGGRQLGTNIADVVTCSTGSLGGHLYHSSFTEINLSRDFQFEQDHAFSFDLEVDVSSTPPPAPNNSILYPHLGHNKPDMFSIRPMLGISIFLAIVIALLESINETA